MLNPAYTYTAFDFETTGLDLQKDEPIQIGIVQFDHEFKVIKTFQSLVKPHKPIKELKEIVTFLTGFNLQLLESSPTIEEVAKNFSQFFTEKTVIVGQNVSFDLAMLQKYFPFTPIAQVDSFPLAKSFLHFLPSYALDVINEQLKKTDQHWASEETTAHDALHDSYASMNVLKQFMEKLTHLRHRYLLLDYVVQRSNGTLQLITRRTQKPYAFEKKQLFFPALKKVSVVKKKNISKDLISFSANTAPTKQSLEQWTFSKFLQKIDREKGPFILAFSHPSKLQLAQQQLDRLWVETSRLQDAATFNAEYINAFLQQQTFTDDELLFTLKYYSQYEQWHGYLDINSWSDRKIFNALTQRAPAKKSSVILATHYQLFEYSQNITQDQTVLFFDHPRWYQQFSRRVQQPFDSMQLITLVDQLAYKYRLHSELPVANALWNYLDQLTIFIGVLSTEIDKLYVGYSESKLEIDSIKDNPRFPKTNSLLSSIMDTTRQLLPMLSEADRNLLNAHISKLISYTEDHCEVEKRMYEWNKRYYLLYHANAYIGYEEFIDLLPKATYHFFSSLATKWYTSLPWSTSSSISRTGWWTDSKLKERSTGPQLLSTTRPSLLAEQLNETTDLQYVISSGKQQSAELFNICVKNKLQEKYTIVAENITGGMGKNIFLALHSEKPVVFIGWYAFYLEALAKKFDFKRIYLYYIHGSMKEVIVQDLVRYAA